MPASRLIDHLFRCVLPTDGGNKTDGELLERFVESRDEAALATLVRRHASMVWGVCLRVLGNHHDAEDAVQATFLVLTRKAPSVLPRSMVGNWLYGVAHQTALHVRRAISRRRAREAQGLDMPDIPAPQAAPASDLLDRLDEELTRLPAIYREVIVLCDLEGRTRKETAGQLGVPEGTVAGRLARAREILARRLSARGVQMTGAMLATGLAAHAASAAAPASAVSSAVKVSLACAAGSMVLGVVSPAVAELAREVTLVMLIKKLKAATAIILLSACVLGGIGTGVSLFAMPDGPARHRPGPTRKAGVIGRMDTPPSTDNSTAWGKEVAGWQAGLAFRPPDRHSYRHGQTVKVVLRLRNVGTKTATFRHLWAFFPEHPPTVLDANGKAISFPRTLAEGLHVPRETTLGPGKEITLYEWQIGLQEVGERSKYPLTIHGTRTFTLECKHIVGPTSAHPVHPAPALDKLATGQLKLEVEEAPGDAIVSTFLKQPAQARVHFAVSPRFHPRVFVYRAEPIPATVADHHIGSDEIVLNVGVQDGARLGHAFHLSPPGSTERVGVAKVLELEARRCVARVVTLDPTHSRQSLKGLSAVCAAPRPEKNQVDVERRLDAQVWRTESLENKIIQEMLSRHAGCRILIAQDKGDLEVVPTTRPMPTR
ncbi:MAG: RNA polymerase sigma factor [Gemmataceae bacterium]